MESDKRLTAALVRDALRRTATHYGLWFAEAVHHLGLDAALKAEAEAGDRALDIIMARLGKALGFEVRDGLPAALLDMDQDGLDALLDTLAVTWLAADGVWFQAVESMASMDEAKRVNDTCWSRFSPLEARRIAALLELPEGGGLAALKTALGHRLYSRVNVQEFRAETATSFEFYMVECRVQAARKRKGLDPYPCGSGGLVEYREFARAIDPRIRATCLGCPPHNPDDWYCAWRFELA